MSSITNSSTEFICQFLNGGQDLQQELLKYLLKNSFAFF